LDLVLKSLRHKGPYQERASKAKATVAVLAFVRTFQTLHAIITKYFSAIDAYTATQL
jgi:hypothetical protein